MDEWEVFYVTTGEAIATFCESRYAAAYCERTPGTDYARAGEGWAR